MSQCIGKIPYKEIEVAERVAKTYTENANKKGGNNRMNGRSYGRGQTFRVYKCNICRFYHLSSKPKASSK